MKFKRHRDGLITEDGRFLIVSGTFYTSCDGPHPMRDGSYHEGGEEHEYVAYDVIDPSTDESHTHGEGFAKQSEAKQFVVEFLIPERR